MLDWSRQRWRVIAVTLIALGCPPAMCVADDATPRDWLRPRALRPGDTIMFVAPAGPADRDRLEPFARRLEAKGFRVRFPPNLYRKDHYLAGSDEERAAELNAALRDPEVRAILAVRGGYGLTRILDRLDYAALRKSPRIVAGYSDLTALHLAVAARAKVVTFHSPMPQHSLFREDGDHAYASASFWRMLRLDASRQGETAFTLDLPSDRPRPKALVRGKATGRLVGGNLSLVCATIGTPYALEPRGNILFLEDTGEAPYRIDRMFSQLRLAGVLDAVAGVVLGTFDKADPAEVDWVVRHYLAAAKVPVLMNFPCGHTPHNATLPHGGRVELDADRGTLRILEPPVTPE